MSSICALPFSENPIGSCQSCRQRKLKCDRGPKGCAQCHKSDSICYYPTSNRKTRQKRGPYRTANTRHQLELENKIKLLEDKNAELSKLFDISSDPINDDTAFVSYTPGSLFGASKPSTTQHSTQSAVDGSGKRGYDTAAAFDLSHAEERCSSLLAHHATTLNDDPKPLSIRTLFQENPTWRDLVLEIMSSKCPQEEDENDTRLNYWMIYTTRVHPVSRILHKPSYDKRFAARRERTIEVDCDVKAVISSICLAAVHSCTVGEVRTYFSDSKQALITRHRLATERALVAAFQTDYPGIAGLQALAIYLSHHDDKKLTRNLARLGLDVLQSMGLHDDYYLQHRSPLEQDLCRRLVWTLRKLELQSSDKVNLSLSQSNRFFRTRMPLNINDEDIREEDLHFPTPRLGQTTMTLSLIEWEIIRLQESLAELGARDKRAEHDTMSVTQVRLQAIEKCGTSLQDVYLCHLDETRPFDWMAIMFTRLNLAKLKLLVEFPKEAFEFSQMPWENRERIYGTSLHILQILNSLKSEVRITQWSWMFASRVEWQALSYVTKILAGRSSPVDCVEAFSVLETCLHDEAIQSDRWNDLRLLISHSLSSQATVYKKALSYNDSLMVADQVNDNAGTLDGKLGWSLGTVADNTWVMYGPNPGLDQLESAGVSPESLQLSCAQTPVLGVETLLSAKLKFHDNDIADGGKVMEWWPSLPMLEDPIDWQFGGVEFS